MSAPAVRVIACLDVDHGRVVKGVHFRNLVDAGDPVARAAHYAATGADEVVFLDVSASREQRGTLCEVVSLTASEVGIPLTVGGGVRTLADVDTLLRAGADKVSLNTAALADPSLVTSIASRFGSQVCVLSVDARRAHTSATASGYEVTTHGGTRGTGVDALDWIAEGQERGAGEILLNSMDADGTRAGFDLPMIEAARSRTRVPLIASGGAGTAADFAAAVLAGADAVLAASVFHFGVMSIAEVKSGLAAAGVCIRAIPDAAGATGW